MNSRGLDTRLFVSCVILSARAFILPFLKIYESLGIFVRGVTFVISFSRQFSLYIYTSICHGIVHLVHRTFDAFYDGSIKVHLFSARDAFYDGGITVYLFLAKDAFYDGGITVYLFSAQDAF